jgi:hypothetical protein
MFSGASAGALLDHRRHLVESQNHDDVVVASFDGETCFTERRRAGGRRVLDPLHGDAGQAELFHHTDAAHDRSEDVSGVCRVDVLEGEPGVAQPSFPLRAIVPLVTSDTCRSGTCRRRTATFFICCLHWPKPEDDDLATESSRQNVELGFELLADLELGLFAGERC